MSYYLDQFCIKYQIFQFCILLRQNTHNLFLLVLLAINNFFLFDFLLIKPSWAFVTTNNITGNLLESQCDTGGYLYFPFARGLKKTTSGEGKLLLFTFYFNLFLA